MEASRVHRADLTSATVSLRQGAYRHATAQLQRALALARQASDRNHEASALVRLGELSLRLGRHEQATDRLQRALALARETGDREDEAEALNGLGEALLGNGQPGLARAQHEAALELAERIGGKYQQARAHRGLAHAHQAADAPASPPSLLASLESLCRTRRPRSRRHPLPAHRGMRGHVSCAP